MISHSHRCIFVHVPKTGGSSVENVIWPGPSKSRTEQDLWMGFVDRYHNRYQTGGLQHLLARQIRTEVGADAFLSYFKFAFVRNPWDKAVSQYVYMAERQDLRDFIGMRKGDGFKRYLDLIARRTHVQWEVQNRFLTDGDGTLLVDYVGRFESFAESARHALERLGLDASSLPHEKRGRRGPYQDYYDAESRERVGELYAEDVRAFGYAFAS